MMALVLDDSKEVGECISFVLEQAGVAHKVFTHPLEALAQMNEETYHAAFVDINLPEIDGFEFAKQFKAAFPEADLVFISGFGDYDKAVEAIKLGTYDFIKKPFQLFEIRLCVNRLLEKQRLVEAHKRMELVEFANTVARELMHELRNPLAAIGGFAKLIARRDYPAERLDEYTKIILRESDRLDNVLRQAMMQLKAGAEPHEKGH